MWGGWFQSTEGFEKAGPKEGWGPTPQTPMKMGTKTRPKASKKLHPRRYNAYLDGLNLRLLTASWELRKKEG